jgi:hypothetical protein
MEAGAQPGREPGRFDTQTERLWLTNYDSLANPLPEIFPPETELIDSTA